MSSETELAIYLVSLEKDVSRRLDLKSNFKKTYKQFQHITAVDGRNLSAKSYFEYTQQYFKKYKRLISPSELGCTLSHIKTLEVFIASSSDYALIVEDDIIGSDECVFEIDSFLKENSFLDYPFLMFCGMYKTRYMRYQVGNRLENGVFKVSEFSYKHLYGTFAYVLNKKMAVNILKTHKEFLRLADSWGDLLPRKKNQLVLYKNYFAHPDIGQESHIENERKELQLNSRDMVNILYRLFRIMLLELLFYSFILLGKRRLR